jgi:Rrf2 family protein
MKLSTKSRYGLRAAMEIAKSYGAAPAKRKNIAAAQDISDSYLENILIVLKNSRIIETSRGVNGGYVLCRAPKDISVLEIITALEGPLDLVECVRSETVCCKVPTCAARTVWKELADSFNTILGRLSLQDVLDREGVLAPSYSI